MQTAYHALELLDSSAETVRDVVRAWLTDRGFKLASSSPSDLRVQARSGSPFALTDDQAERVMEVIIRSTGTGAAISVYHHTTRLGPITGVMHGDILRNEVNALLAFLVEMAVPDLP
jgi:hypothetical protein